MLKTCALLETLDTFSTDQSMSEIKSLIKVQLVIYLVQVNDTSLLAVFAKRDVDFSLEEGWNHHLTISAS